MNLNPIIDMNILASGRNFSGNWKRASIDDDQEATGLTTSEGILVACGVILLGLFFIIVVMAVLHSIKQTHPSPSSSGSRNNNNNGYFTDSSIMRNYGSIWSFPLKTQTEKRSYSIPFKI